MSNNHKFQVVSFFENLDRQKNLEKKAWANGYDYRLNQYANFDENHGISLESSLVDRKRIGRMNLPTRLSLNRSQQPSYFSLHKVSRDIIKFNKVKRLAERQNWTVTANVLVRSWNSKSLFGIMERDRNGRQKIIMLL